MANVTKLNLTNSAEISGLSLSQKLAGVAGISNFRNGHRIGQPVGRGLRGHPHAGFWAGTAPEKKER
uniref:hypothetical protein n=1 Tax=Candidatus Symbiothrix dinenymphae TaxID=467085 RepID=UPI0013152485